MSESLTNILESGRDITASQLRSPKQGLAASVSRTRSRQTGSPAASPFAPEQFTGPSFAGNLPQAILSSLYAGQGVPQQAQGTMLGRMLEEMFRRGKGDDAAIMRAFEVISKIEGSIDDLNDQIAAMTRELNKLAPVAEAERAPERPAKPRISRTSPIKAPRAPSAASPPKPPREPPQVATGGEGGEERPYRGSRRFEHDLMRAGKAILAGAEISAEAIAEQLSVSAGRAAKILAELTHREVVSPVERGKRQPLVHSPKELAGRLGARGGIPGVIQGEGPSNARAYTRMLRGTKVSPPSRRPPTVDEGTGRDDDEPEDLGFASDPTKPPPPPGSRANRALRAAWDAVYRRRVQVRERARERARAAAREKRRQRLRNLPKVQRGLFVPPEQAPRGEEAIGAQVIRPEAPPIQESPEARRRRELYEAELALRTPTAEKVRGMSLRDRYRRLKRSGMLINRQAVSRKYGVERPSMGLVVEESERREEERRQGQLQARQGRFGDYSLRAQYGLRLAGSKLADAGSRLAGMFGAKGTQQRLAGVAQQQAPGAFRQFAATQAARAGIGAAAGIGGAGALGALFSPGGQLALAAAALPASLWAAVKAGEAFATGTLEASRGLEKWSGSIAKSFAMLRRQDLQLEQSMARNTQGSTVTLAKSVESLKSELQPLKEAARTLVNLTAAGVARGVEAGVELAKLDPNLRGVLQLLGLIERKLDERQKEKGALFFDQVRDLMNGVPPAPKNQRPE